VPGVLIRERYPTTGPQQVIEQLQETGPPPAPEPNLPPGKIMYMPEETGMYTEEIIMVMFSNEAMVSGVVTVLRDLLTGPEASSR
jgi:hypothetical protein